MPEFQRFIQYFIFFTVLKITAQTNDLQNITVLTLADPYFGIERQISVYLPHSYEDSEKRYPVLYMLDGQNIFDSKTAYAGEWEVDEFMNKNNFEQIVVAIAHGNEKRIEELTPFVNEKYSSGSGDEFSKLLLLTIKPYIDQHYRTLSDAPNTSIAGASLGGLMAYYVLLKHPEVFSKAIALSPSFWINPEIYDLTTATTIPTSSVFYIATGADEGELMLTSYKTMLNALINKGVYHKQLFMERVEGGRHNEAFWKQQFRQAYLTLYSSSTE